MVNTQEEFDISENDTISVRTKDDYYKCSDDCRLKVVSIVREGLDDKIELKVMSGVLLLGLDRPKRKNSGFVFLLPTSKISMMTKF